MITADGRVRVQIFPHYDLGDRKNLAAFVDGVREVIPEVAGSAAEVLESGRAVVRALQQALFGAVVAITVVLLLVWRRIDDTALVLIPLFLAAALTIATIVLLDIPFNFADVIVLPLLLGIGVDSCIHMIHRARIPDLTRSRRSGDQHGAGDRLQRAHHDRGFGTMGFASHVGLATLGQMLTLGVSLTRAVQHGGAARADLAARRAPAQARLRGAGAGRGSLSG